MKAIKDRRGAYAMLSALCVLLTVLLIIQQRTELAMAGIFLTVIMLSLLYRQNRLLQVAMTIYDSRILTVPSSIVTAENDPRHKQVEETIVSTFGLLLGNKVYQWNCQGVFGIRLRKVLIDREYIHLSFGTDGKMLCVELLHGVASVQAVSEIKQKLWHETGVEAEIVGWE